MVTALALLLCTAPTAGPNADAAYEVVWTTPSADSSGSMPLGNGDLGCNAWVEPGGDLVLLLSKTDAWSELARLLKLGRVRVRFEPALPTGEGFRQRLALREGAMTVEAGTGRDAVSLRLWIDAHAPVVRVEARSERPRTMTATVELWRTAPRVLSGAEVDGDVGRLAEGAGPIIEQPDTVFDETPTGTVVWAHRNPTSVWRASLELQGLGRQADAWEDPLLGRTSGCLMCGAGLTKPDRLSLRSLEPRTRHLLEIHALTAMTESADEWPELIRTRAAITHETAGLETAWEAHRAWWAAFWQRSWIHVAGGPLPGARGLIAANDLPLRIGADEQGGSGFVGQIAAVRVYGAALAEPQLAAHARAAGLPPHEEGLVLAWPDGDASMPGLRECGEAPVTPGPHGPALTLRGRGWLEADRAPTLDLTGDCTFELWVRPDALPEAGGRLIDKCPVGTDQGFVLDTYPGASLRLITTAGTLRHDAGLREGEWVHLAGVVDARSGLLRLYVGGVPVAEQAIAGRGGPEVVTRGYALQRFINACGGRGGAPIKFNGSIFTVEPREGAGAGLSPDYRLWGSAYWIQNTRLPYFAMPAAGDFDLMEPFFRMFEAAAPLERARVREWFGHEGIVYPETMSFWGTYGNSDYGLDRTGRKPREVVNPFIGTHYTGSLEIVALMLARARSTADTRFLRQRVLPLADEVLTFFEQHYGRAEDGTLALDPAQAVETWWDVRNPTPDVAGLRWCVGELLAYPPEVLGAERAARLRALRRSLPRVPLGEGEGGSRILPAEEVRCDQTNSETPELYAVWPFRLYGEGRPGLATALRTWEARQVRHRGGWGQDPIQAACLGLADEAADAVVERFATQHAGSRFPAFWGPNFDWVPDQDHGAVAMIALQEMLLRSDGRRILLLGGWPREWDVEFLLHTRDATQVRCIVRDGAIRLLEVTPQSRRADVEVLGPR